MNAETIHAALQSAHLRVPGRQGHNATCHTNNGVAGIAVPKTSGTSRNHRGFFVPSVLAMLNGGPDRGAARLADARIGTANPVRTVTLDRSLGSGIQPDYEQTIMNTSPTLGTLPEIRLVSRATLEKRVRRELAKQGRKLLKSRPGTPAYREYGQYAVENDRRTVLETHLDLVKLARDLGVMQDHEYLDPHSDWRYYCARHATQIVDGKTIHSFARLSRNFQTQAEAERHAKRMNFDGPIGFVGFDTREA